MSLRAALRRCSLAALTALACAGCAGTAAPVVSPIPPPSPRPIVVFVPGFTGTVLRDPQTDRVVWGDGAAALRPHEGGLRSAVALDPARDPRPPLEVGGPVLELRVLGVRKAVYGPLLRTMEANGWTVADGVRPRPGANFLFFPYDWRRDSVEVARDLARRLEALRDEAGGGPLRVNLVGQSQGAQVVRWLLKYGAATRDDAEAGIRRPPAGVRIDRVVFLGSSTGGSLRTLRFLDEGRSYVPLIGRKFRPEVIFTFASLYEDLPVFPPGVFFDENGRPLELDVLDGSVWRRLGLSIYGAEAGRRLKACGNDGVLGDAAIRDTFLDRQLAEARRFHRLLDRSVPDYPPVHLSAIEGEGFPTPGRAIVEKRAGTWRLRYPKGGIDGLSIVDGDGHAPRESALALSRQELDAFTRPPRYVRAKHFDLLTSPEAQRILLEILAEPVAP